MQKLVCLLGRAGELKSKAAISLTNWRSVGLPLLVGCHWMRLRGRKGSMVEGEMKTSTKDHR